MFFIKTILSLIPSLLLLPLPAAAAIYFEPEAGVFITRYLRSDSRVASGLQGGFSFGYQQDRWQAGAETQPRYFQTEDQGTYQNYTTFPIGISVRYKWTENWRAHLAWHWDDVLYSDFRPKFLDGFKIPKDYEMAYEGPGSFRFGVGHKIETDLYLNHSLYVQQYRSFKRRRPAESTGTLDPNIRLLSYSLTISRIF